MSSKLQIITQSGRPADPVKAKAYDEAWKLVYDRCVFKSEGIYLKTTGRLTKLPHMQILARLCNYAERALIQKYSLDELVALPRSPLAWKRLIARYGNYPIMIANRADGAGIVLVSADKLNE